MELGTTKELDTVGEITSDCADSLQRIDSFRSVWLAKPFLLQSSSPKIQKPTKSSLRFASTMISPSLLLPPLPNTSSSYPLLAMPTSRIAFRPLWSYRIHRLSSPNDLIASIQLDLYRTTSLQRTNNRPYASLSMQDPVLNTLFRRGLKQSEKVRRR